MEQRYGILFDLDGTLIDNEHLKGIAFSKAIERFGGESHPSTYQEVMGMDGKTISSHFMKKANMRIDMQEYRDLVSIIYQNLLETELIIKPGADSFLNDSKAKGLRLAIVSSASSSSVNHIMDALNLGKYFDLVITGDDVKNKKPDPECFLLASECMSIPTKKLIVFEDTEAGLKAAEKAGIPAICMRHVYNHSNDLSLAFAEYESFDSQIVEIRKSINSIFGDSIF